MKPRIHTDHLWIRIGGSLTGAAFVAMGAYALMGGHNLDEAAREHAMGFGIAALVAGIWAIAVSWMDEDLSGVWCRPPRRWSALRAKRRR